MTATAILAPVSLKACTKCGEVKPATTEFFSAQKGGKFGVTSKCKPCVNADSKSHHSTNRDCILAGRAQRSEEINARRRLNYIKNKDIISARNKQYIAQNPEATKARKNAWYQENKERIAETRMFKVLRLAMIFITPLVFWGAWYVVPDLLDAQSLRWLSGVVTVLWGLEFYFFQRLQAVSSVDGLSSKEHERLVLRLASIRRRVWWIGGIGLICALLIWVMTSLQLPNTSPLYAALVGVLFGISLSYLILIPGWLNESQHFIDEVRRQDLMAKKRAEASKIMQSLKDKK